MSLVAGTRLGPYEIVGPIGAGGMGEVYRATDTRLGRDVAVKLLPIGVAGNQQALERFRREARLVASLNHPGICTLYDLGDHNGQPFLVLELLDGTTLGAHIGGRHRPVDEIGLIATELADALDSAHKRGIVHRDLKPANIIITARGHAKILDFGVATLAQEPLGATLATAAPLTGDGAAVGTLAYMAPEQVRGEIVDQRADLFALGLVLYEMASGRPAFTGTTTGVLADAVLNHEPAALRTFDPAFPAPLEAIIVKLLEKDRELRYQHAADVRADLKRFRRDTGQVQPASGAASSTPAMPRPGEPPSLVVLPFADLSPGHDQQYFCEGMANEIMTALSALTSLRLASRTSAARCHEKGLDIGEIGRQLKVQTVLEGSVRKAGNRLRIAVQLTKVDDGYQLWAERYDRDMDDVFAVQDEIASAIADRLRVKLATDGGVQVAPGTESLEAYNQYLQGRYHWARRNRWRTQVALESFTKAVAIDPNYAAAHAGIADCYTVMAVYSVRPSVELRDAARTAAERALQLAPALAEAHHSMGGVRIFLEWDWPGGEASLRKARALNPRLAISAAHLGLALITLGRFEEAAESDQLAVTLEPDSALIANVASSHYLWLGQFERAYELAERSLALEPDGAFAHCLHANALRFLGRTDEAIQSAERGVETGERQPVLLSALGQAYATARRVADADRILAELTARSAHQYIAPSYFLDIHAALGGRDEACHWLERAYADRNGLLVRLGSSPEFDLIRDDPRFRAVTERMHLPQ